MKKNSIFPLGKIPAETLAKVIAENPSHDPRVLVGPGIGVDCAVIDAGSPLMVYKSDPITFATNEIGWYAVQVNANDIATTGAVPRWFLETLLLPEGKATASLVEEISQQVYAACQQLDITVIGGHTEVTHGLDHPILMGTMIGEVNREDLVTPRGAQVGDRLLVTKGVPIEATAILSREFPNRLKSFLTPEELSQAGRFLHDPGIGVLRDARIALACGKITAMHDPTEGGLATALWELAESSGHTLVIDQAAIPIPDLSRRICQALHIDPLGAIASGALLFCTPPQDAGKIRQGFERSGILCADIGEISTGPAQVLVPLPDGSGFGPMVRPPRDEIARLFERSDP
jgi:hydrogenase maturation factor